MVCSVCIDRGTGLLDMTEPFIFSYSEANIYAKDKDLCTPVLTAAVNKKVEAFHCLLELMDLKDHLKNPIFQVLQVKKHQAETLKVSLHSLKISMSWSLVLVVDICPSVFQQFLITDSKWGYRLIKSTDSHKNSVLHVTARENDLSAMAVLMKHKVDSNIKNVDGKTPMHLAAEMGHHE